MSDPDFREVEPPKPVDREAVEQLAGALMAVVNSHYREGEWRAGKPALALEVLNALAFALSPVFAGTTFDPQAFAFFRRALADNLEVLAQTSAHEEALEARVTGRRIVPPWLDYKTMSAIRLDEHEFRQLVAGKEVVTTAGNTGELVRMILADIGFNRMAAAIAVAVAGDGADFNFIVDATSVLDQDGRGE
jgi:hypothetical protein